jgi:hypothetical protein
MKSYLKFKDRFQDMKTFSHYLIAINEVRIMSGSCLCKVFWRNFRYQMGGLYYCCTCGGGGGGGAV